MAKKYSGISFGGIFQRVKIYGDRFVLIYGKDKNDLKYEVRPLTTFEKLSKKLYLLFPLLDVFIIIGALLFAFLTSILIPDPIGGETPSKLFSLIAQYGPIVIIIIEYVLLYKLIIKGLATWHGSEHKIIAAMENNDIDNAKDYDPIHERCGGTLLPTIIFSQIVWSYFSMKTGIFFGMFTCMSFFVYLNVKFFHKYDKLGIWFGKWLQRKFTVREPHKWQLDIGIKGAKELIIAENS